MQAHSDQERVLTQACLAISTLAVKRINDKVHNGNTRKLVTKVPSRPSSSPSRPPSPLIPHRNVHVFASTVCQGAIEGVIAALQKYPQDVNVQRAGAMAVASLARLEPNRDKLGSLGAAELVLNGFKTHPNQVPTAPATAIELRSYIRLIITHTSPTLTAPSCRRIAL